MNGIVYPWITHTYTDPSTLKLVAIPYKVYLCTYIHTYKRIYTGNALGYVRMVRSASMFYCSEAVKYLPDFEDIIKFETYAGPTGEGRLPYI